MKYLDRHGCSLQDYKNYVNIALNTKAIKTYYQPSSKIAILIANEKYENLSKLATPSIDCDTLTSSLRDLGFVIVTIKNTRSLNLKLILTQLFSVLCEDSYCKQLELF